MERLYIRAIVKYDNIELSAICVFELAYILKLIEAINCKNMVVTLILTNYY